MTSLAPAAFLSGPPSTEQAALAAKNRIFAPPSTNAAALAPQNHVVGPPSTHVAALALKDHVFAPAIVHNSTISPSTAVAPEFDFVGPPSMARDFSAYEYELPTLGSGELYPFEDSTAPIDPETEDPPPIPVELMHKYCYYGFEFTNTEIENYAKVHDESYPYGPTFHKARAVRWHAGELGIINRTMLSEAWCRGRCDPLSSKEDFVWFNNIRHMRRGPTKAKIDALRERLGVQQQARWIVI